MAKNYDDIINYLLSHSGGGGASLNIIKVNSVDEWRANAHYGDESYIFLIGDGESYQIGADSVLYGNTTVKAELDSINENLTSLETQSTTTKNEVLPLTLTNVTVPARFGYSINTSTPSLFGYCTYDLSKYDLSTVTCGVYAVKGFTVTKTTISGHMIICATSDTTAVNYKDYVLVINVNGTLKNAYR